MFKLRKLLLWLHLPKDIYWVFKLLVILFVIYLLFRVDIIYTHIAIIQCVQYTTKNWQDDVYFPREISSEKMK